VGHSDRRGGQAAGLSRRARISPLLREHRAFLIVLALAALLRAVVTFTYHPLLMQITDAWGYLNLAWNLDLELHFVIAPDRPFGYPLLLWLLDRPFGFHASTVTGLQHLAGLATGTLAYVTLVRLGVRRWLAVVVAALVLLDTSAIALEQTIMPEAWFTFALMSACALVVLAGDARWPLVVAGLLLGSAVALRLSALVAVPVWVLFVLWTYRHHPRAIALGVVAVALPIGAYAAVHADATGRIGFADASGFFLYGRVAHLADCDRMTVPAGTRFLCQPASERIDDPGYYIWNMQSPARRRFPGWGATPDEQAANDRLVGSFARATIRSRPFAYARLVGRDFATFFTPGVDRWVAEDALVLPGAVFADPGPLGRRVWRGYRNHARAPAGLLSDVGEVLRIRRAIVTPFALVALASLALALVTALRRRPPDQPRVRETLLFAAVPLVTMLASAATAQFGLRYLVAVAPLLLVAGALGLDGLLQRSSRRAGRLAQSAA
jgi:hypothetical protein